jgi:hypothetical protein
MSEMISTSGISSMYKFSKDFASRTMEVFKSTRIKAKLTGKLLAHYLAADCGESGSEVLRG